MFLDDGQQANGQMGCSFYKIKISSSKLHVSESQYFFPIYLLDMRKILQISKVFHDH